METMLPRERKTLATKKRIVETAGNIIRSYGLQSLTVKNLCEEAEVAYGSFYHYFGTKENVVYAYARSLFDWMMRENPAPETLHGGDFVRRVIWALLVYARFSEKIGRENMRYICQNCPDDLFYADYFTPCVRDVIRRGYELGTVRIPFAERLVNIADDVAITYRGAVMCWYTGFELESHRGSLCVGMEHVVYQVLDAFRSEGYHSLTGNGGKFAMLTDDPDFTALFRTPPELG